MVVSRLPWSNRSDPPPQNRRATGVGEFAIMKNQRVTETQHCGATELPRSTQGGLNDYALDLLLAEH